MRLTAARLRPERPFVVATRTATVMDEDGDPVDLIAGFSGVTVGHDLTVRYPHLFAARSLQPPPAPSKVAPPKPARTDGTPAWLLDTATVDHRDTPVIRLEPDRPATHTVTIAPDALRDLHDHAEYSNGGSETGGGLLIRRGSPPRVFQVAAVSGALGARRATNGVHLPYGHIDRWADARRDHLPWARRGGDWHTHPTATGTRPSRPDLHASASEITEVGSPYVSVIVTPHPVRGFTRPALHAWVTERSPHGGAFTCRPARTHPRASRECAEPAEPGGTPAGCPLDPGGTAARGGGGQPAAGSSNVTAAA